VPGHGHVDLDDVVPADREWLPSLIGLLSSSETNEVTSTTLSPRRPAASVDEPHNAG